MRSRRSLGLSPFGAALVAAVGVATLSLSVAHADDIYWGVRVFLDDGRLHVLEAGTPAWPRRAPHADVRHEVRPHEPSPCVFPGHHAHAYSFVHPDCGSLHVMERLALMTPDVDPAMVAEIAGMTDLVCGVGRVRMDRWPSGAAFHSVPGSYRYPNGKTARSHQGRWYYANGELAASQYGTWHYPSGEVALRRNRIWYTVDGKRVGIASYRGPNRREQTHPYVRVSILERLWSMR